MDVTGKKVLVVGTGISGIAACRLLCAKGAGPVLIDSKTDLLPEKIKERLNCGDFVEIILGELPKAAADTIEAVVLSPGVPLSIPLVKDFKERGIPILSEVELAYQAAQGRLLAITGTNGKTTTTALVGEIMKSYFDSVFVAGNIGTPYTETAQQTGPGSVTVAEISSFQLEAIDTFHPQTAAILNITPDHLDRHHTMECYQKTKERITANQTKADTLVLNYDDEALRETARKTKAQVVFFSRKHFLREGIYLDRDRIMYARNGIVSCLLERSEIQLLGSHNLENIMAAIGIAASVPVPMEKILDTVRQFTGVEHRIEYVAAKKGVYYYNDSKGTNTDAAIKGIQAMVRPTVLIGGGYDKNAEYDTWIEAFKGKVKYLILLGQTKEKIAECARKHGFHHIIITKTLEEAVLAASKHAEPGDAVLLSPACASWGMFRNFEERGRVFKECVYRLKED